MVLRTPTAFISYSREDSAFSLQLAEDLKAVGASVWIDQIDIDPGREWDSAIEDAVIQSPRMLLILSPNSVRSRNVRNEISFALKENKTIIPVLYQDCTIPLQLQRIQHIDFRFDYTHGLKKLLKVLGVEIGTAANATATGNTANLVDESNRQLPKGEQAQATAQSLTHAPELPDSRENVVFISYSHKDQRCARAVRDALMSVNLQVWFDSRDLYRGDDFKLKILQAIEKCSVFVPVISREAISGKSRFLLYREWSKAQSRAHDLKPGNRFIQPLVVDKTKIEELPEFRGFTSVNCVWLEEGRVPPIFVESVIAAICGFRSQTNPQ